MIDFRKFIIFALLITLTGCGHLRNKGIGVGEGGTVSAYNNLDRHGAIALFQSHEGKACYDTIKEAITFVMSEKKAVATRTPDPDRVTNEFDALMAQSKAMADLARDALKNAADMVAYSNGLVPQDPIVQLASLCKQTNYYDSQISKSNNRHETLRAIAAEVGDVLKTGSPYAAIAYVGSKVGDRIDTSGNNNAIGDRNAVADPTVVEQPDPLVVKPEVIIVEPGSEEEPVE